MAILSQAFLEFVNVIIFNSIKEGAETLRGFSKS